MIFQPQIAGKPLPALTNPGTAADLLSGKQLIDADGNVLAGTMANQGAKSVTLDQGDSYTIPAGYHNGSGVVSVRKPVIFSQLYNWNDITDPENFSITLPSQYELISDDVKENMLSITFRGRGKYSTYSETNVSAGLLPELDTSVSAHDIKGFIATASEYGGYVGSHYMKVSINGNTITFGPSKFNNVTLTSITYLTLYVLVYSS